MYSCGFHDLSRVNVCKSNIGLQNEAGKPSFSFGRMNLLIKVKDVIDLERPLSLQGGMGSQIERVEELEDTDGCAEGFQVRL
jgi:hypothetical protein